MTNSEIKSKGLKWAQGANCQMYVVKVDNEYQWWMISAKTGRHMIKNNGKYGQPYACERVLNHWAGFKQNQSR